MKPDITTVAIIAITTRIAASSPSATISPSAMRTPRTATPQRSSVFTQNVMPGWNAAFAATRLSATPISSASTIAGIGTDFGM